MIVEDGEYYEDAKGKKQGPVFQCNDLPWWRYPGSKGLFTSDGISDAGLDPDLIRKWVEPDTPPIFKDMTDAEQGALLLAKHKGKPVEAFIHECWEETDDVFNEFPMRIAPSRIHGSVETDADGNPDFSTWEADQ